ncbi:MAG: DNA-deoxyinosine glycosylase [Ruminococcaceae bacterium]|nr:DNA-deoxyinosine glycosylase [Oscillospiraceae bacterium]
MQLTTAIHNIDPIYNQDSKILILGSFPSVKSREGQFFYDHPQNRFWKVMAGVLGSPVPQTHAQKRIFLLEHHIALWDVLQSCEISGSSDASIQNAVPNDLSRILESADIQAIFCNGAASYNYYVKYTLPLTGMEAIKLPSTSPANASFSLDKLKEQWQVICSYRD